MALKNKSVIDTQQPCTIKATKVSGVIVDSCLDRFGNNVLVVEYVVDGVKHSGLFKPDEIES